MCFFYSKDSSILWSGVVQGYICSYVLFYIAIGYVCTNIYISGSKPLFCIYILAVVFVVFCHFPK